jgi:hypothetical protein
MSSSGFVVHGFLISRCWFSRVTSVKLLYCFGGVVEVARRVPGFVFVVEPLPLHLVLELVAVVVGIEDFFNFPLFLAVDDDGGRRRLDVSGDGRISCCCGFEE